MINRLHYRAKLAPGQRDTLSPEALAPCLANIRTLQREGRLLTAALYLAHTDDIEDTLFLYYEDASAEGLLSPEDFMMPLDDKLRIWPDLKADRKWVQMHHIYYHQEAMDAEHWKRAQVPDMRRGRIAFLYPDKLFSYVYYHKAIVDEGLLKGDKYQSIALHENVLFSYFEEPKTFVNIRNEETESKVIEDWLAVDPESHFIHTKEGLGENFMFLPALFALGAEDLKDEEI